MKIIVAETGGFCWGVRRAMDKILDLSRKKEEIYTLGPLIHNNQVVALLESKGVKPEKKLENLDKGTVVIRAHGTTPQVLNNLKEKGLDVVNLTCPKVGKVQGIIKGHINKGYQVVIVGDEGHAEVVSLKGYSNNTAFVVGSVEEAEKLPEMEKVIVVSQTTFNYDEFFKIVDKVREKAKEVKEFCTICDSTHRRQDEVKKIASQVDCMIIIGGKHSANTTRLAEISKQYCPVVYHIETEDELKGIDFSNFDKVGVSAGASTPSWIINSVVDYLRFVDEKSRFSKRVLGIVFNSGLFRGFSAFVFSYGLLSLANFQDSLKFSVIAFLYIFSMTLFNGIIDLEGLRFSNPTKFYFLKENKTLLIAIGIISLTLLALLSINISLNVFFIILLASLLGLLYRIKLRLKGRIMRLFDIPGSKNIIYALAWSIVIVFNPLFIYGKSNALSSFLMFLFVFTVVFVGSILSDIKDIQGDKFYGRETLPILIGTERALRIANWLVIILILFIGVAAITDGQNFSMPILTMLFGGYYMLVNKLVVKKRNVSPLYYEFLLDNFALIPGLLAFVFSFFK
ncbi:4-hydroxy-3-methylbut-2-enyl diphosphate reductase [Thermotomaculum hydrothermale]|uniref:4-hydroxy-3-methylbut-2-enyl diphosphate reductase n=1 Tax=Thermotomaculum hydrothermale TaxID=981385 RepID=A0A7R6SYA3_9BACT|nr:4-hydroxy-3-methylbut-2-enyl diphosphate reductase [Thermotomaculum hydrothermale]BBB32564.1 4-hydroxy-3-methylbut-2-enyl diphosphate reductase [Thermotomaculum hydrothermale]